MDYEKEEQKVYEHLWGSLKKLPEGTGGYKTRTPLREAVDYLKFLKRKKGPVLDLGCGNGRHAILFAKAGFTAYGIDFSKSAIKLARENAKENSVDVNFRAGSALDLPYPKSSFDIVVDFGCLHHLRKSQWRQYKKNLLKVLKPPGHYLLYCFSTNTKHIPGYRPKNRNWHLRKNHYHHFFDYKEVTDFFGKDFKILKKFEAKGTSIKRPKKFRVFYMQKIYK